jgi:hypothetical protein
MFKYLKTRKRHFYKLKKRYQKKNKTRKNKSRKNKKMLSGGGKTEQEIINEVITKGKYDEWDSLGRNFGLTSNTLKAPFFLVRPYKYYDVDGNITHVSMVTNKYRPDVDNIAVFKQYIVKDPSHVDQQKYKIVNISESLSTSGLATCTGLAMIIGTKKFMTHLDASTPMYPIIEAINQTIITEQIEPASLRPIIYYGDLDSSVTLQKAKEICLTVGIPETNYEIVEACMFDTVKI